MADRRKKRTPPEDRVMPSRPRGGKHRSDGFVIRPEYRGPLANDNEAPIVVIEDREQTNPGWPPGHANGKANPQETGE